MDAWFVHPGLLLLAIAAVIPWWLARRARRQPVTLPWGAMRWLNAARQSQSRTVRPKWWIPLLRTLLLLAIVAAISIPQWTPPSLTDPFASQSKRTWWILVIDDGPSSTYAAAIGSGNSAAPLNPSSLTTASQRRIDSAIREASELVEQAAEGDAFSLVSLAAPQQPQIIGPLSDPADTQRRIQEWRPSMWRAEGLLGLEQVAQALEEVQRSEEAFDWIEIVVWSHQRASTWKSPSDLRFVEVLNKLTESATLHWRDWGSVHANNAAIVRVEGIGGARFAGESFPIWVTISNPDTTQVATRRLSWRIDERLQGETEVRLEPGATSVTKLDLEAPPIGRHAISFALDDDPLPLDSIAWEVLDVVERFELRLWSEDPEEIRAFRAWASARQSDGFSMTVQVGPPVVGDPVRVNDSIWIVGSVSHPATEAMAELNRHVAAGGGLLLACGDAGSPAPWLASLGLSSGNWSVSPAGWESLRLATPTPPPLRVFVGDAATTLSSTPVWRNWVRTDPWEPIWEVGLIRENGTPLLLSAQVGRGRVALLTTSWGAVPAAELATTDQVPEAWSAVAWWPSFPPLLARLIDDLSGADPRRSQWFSRQPPLGRWSGLETPESLSNPASKDSPSNTGSFVSDSFLNDTPERQPRFVSPRTSLESVDSTETLETSRATDTDSLRARRSPFPDRPGIYEVETSSGGTRWEAWNLAHDATAFNASQNLPGWSSLDVPLTFPQTHSRQPLSTDISTPLALGLIALLLIEAFAARRVRRLSSPQRLNSQSSRTDRKAQAADSPVHRSVIFMLGVLNPSANIDPGTAPRLLAQTNTQELESVWLPTWDQSYWQMILIALLVGFAMTWALRHEWQRTRGRMAIAIRWLTLLSLLFAAQGWVQRPVIERPARVALLVDLSASMNSPNDLADLQRRFSETLNESNPTTSAISDPRWRASRIGTVLVPLLELNDWPAAWGTARDVEWYGFGERLEKFEDWRDLAQRAETPNASQSRLGEAMRELIEQPGSRPLTAVVLVSDGVSTEAGLPVGWEESLRRSATPWFPIRIGKGDERGVVELSTTPFPETLFVGETVIAEASVTAVAWTAGTLRVEWIDPQEGRTLAVRRWSPTGNGDRRVFSTPLEIDRVGPQRWQIQVVDDRDGAVLTEPRWARFEAREHRPRVLLIAGEPTPEFRYLKHALERARSPSADGPAFELVSWLQSADLEYAATDASATSSFPVADADLATFDIIVVIDPLTVADAPGRGLTRSDLQRIRDHVDGEGANLVLIAGPNTQPDRWRGTPLETFLPCRIEDLVRSDATSPSASEFTLETTAIGSSLAALRPLELDPIDGTPSPSSTTDQPLTNEDPLFNDSTNSNITTLRFLSNHVWGATRLRSGVRPLVVLRSSTPTDEPRVALTLQPLGRGLVVYQGFDEAYRLRRRMSDEWAARYWVQWFHHLARHRWIDRNPVSRLSTDRDTYRVGESVRLLATHPITESIAETQVEITGPDLESRMLSLSASGAEAGRFEGTFEVVVAGKHEVRLAGTSATDSTSIEFDVLPRRHESDPAPPDLQLLEQIANLSGGRLINAEQLKTPQRWLPTPTVTQITSGVDEPAWKRPLIPLLFGCWLIGLLCFEWWLRQE